MRKPHIWNRAENYVKKIRISQNVCGLFDGSETQSTFPIYIFLFILVEDAILPNSV